MIRATNINKELIAELEAEKEALESSLIAPPNH